MPKHFQVLLPGSGRGVRFKELGPREHSMLLSEAAKIVGAVNADSMLDLKRKEWDLGVQKFIIAVTAKDGFESMDDVLKPETVWKQTTEQQIDTNFDTWFTAKDNAYLIDIFRDHHEVSPAEIEAISGKVLPVSAD